MKSLKIQRTIWRFLLALTLGGVLNGLNCGGLKDIAANFNPCGTLLNCDPYEYDWLFIDRYPNWDIDPTCTIPGACAGTETTTGTATTGTTTTGTTTQ